MSGGRSKGPRSDDAGYRQIGEHTDPTSVNKKVAILEKTGKEGFFMAKKIVQKSHQKPLNVVKKNRSSAVYVDNGYYLLEGQEKLNVANSFAFREVLAGEWLRLMNPGQPKVRVRFSQGEVKVLSQKLEGFIPLAQIANHSGYKKIWEGVQSGKIRGLASAAFSAISTLNADLHLNNIGVALNESRQYEIFVIDTGMCYFPRAITAGDKNTGKGISARDLENFPFITDAEFIHKNLLDNFLWIIHDGHFNNGVLEYRRDGRWDFDLLENEAFIEEKHSRILCEILLSDEFVENFMLQYAVEENAKRVSVSILIEEAKGCAKLHNERKKNIREEVLKLSDFRDFLSTDKAVAVYEAFMAQVLNFQTKSKRRLWGDDSSFDRDRMRNELIISFESLKSLALEEFDVFYDAKEYLTASDSDGDLEDDLYPLLEDFSGGWGYGGGVDPRFNTPTYSHGNRGGSNE